MKRLAIGLTGCMGSGKTLICNVFAHLGIAIYNADVNAKKLYLKKSVLDSMQSMFGQQIVSQGKIDKQALSDIVFNDKDKLQLLNNFIHPLVKEDYLLWQAKQHSAYTIMESAIIFESHWQMMFDKIICVDTPMDLIIERTALRDNISQEKVKQRLLNQMPPEEKISRSNYVITNDNVALVIPQVLNIHKKIMFLIDKQS